MPELPEVERAVIRLRRYIVGRTITSVEVHHAALRRRISPAQRRSLAGALVVGVRRRGKHQLIDLADGRVLHAHFRMSGDWALGKAAVTARYPRATVHLDGGGAIVLDDPRALSSLVLVSAGEDPIAGVGPDADDVEVTATWLEGRFAKRRSPIKVALLDQAVLSGIGNIYAAEALWESRIDPRRATKDLKPPEIRRLLKAIRKVLKRASGARYADGGRFNVYDRAGKKCKRCRGKIERLPQAGRSTYWCPTCQA